MRTRLGRSVEPFLVLVAVATAWQLAVTGGLLSPNYFPGLPALAQELAEQMTSVEVWTAILQTLAGWALGLLIAVPTAVTLGVAIGSSWLTFRAVRPVIEFLRPVPSVSYLPLAVIALGTQLRMTVFLVALGSFWPVLLQTMYGVRDQDVVTVDTARAFRFGYLDRMRIVVLPSALPYIMTGVRISSTVALILAVTSGMVVGAPGIGRGILRAQLAGNTAEMYSLIFLAGVLGWSIDYSVRRVQRLIMRTHPAQRAELAGAQ